MKRREFVTLLGGAAALAARRARAAARAHAAHRRAHAPGRGRSRRAGPHRGVPAGVAAIGLDRRPQRADRHSLGRGRCRTHSQIRGGIGRARPGRYPGLLALPAAGRHCCRQPARCRSCSRLSPIRSAPASSRAWRGRAAMSPVCHVRIQLEREMAGTAQADRAPRDASGGPSGSCNPAGIGQFGVIQAVAPSFGVELTPVNVRDAARSSAPSRPSRAPRMTA